MTLRGVLLDLDGTVYHHDNPLPGAPEAVSRLRDRDLSICFFSNNPLHGATEYVERLQSMGIDARPGEATSSAVVTREYVDSHHAGDDVFVIGSSSIRERIARGDAAVVEEPHDADVLLASWTDEFHYSDMVDAIEAALDRLGHDPGEILVVGDRLETDIRLGERAGMETAVVMTGVTDDATLAASDLQPDHVLDSLAEVDSLL